MIFFSLTSKEGENVEIYYIGQKAKFAVTSLDGVLEIFVFCDIMAG